MFNFIIFFQNLVNRIHFYKYLIQLTKNKFTYNLYYILLNLFLNMHYFITQTKEIYFTLENIRAISIIETFFS